MVGGAGGGVLCVEVMGFGGFMLGDFHADSLRASAQVVAFFFASIFAVDLVF